MFPVAETNFDITLGWFPTPYPLSELSGNPIGSTSRMHPGSDHFSAPPKLPPSQLHQSLLRPALGWSAWFFWALCLIASMTYLIFLQIGDTSADESRAGAGGPVPPTMSANHLWVGGGVRICFSDFWMQEEWWIDCFGLCVLESIIAFGLGWCFLQDTKYSWEARDSSNPGIPKSQAMDQYQFVVC